MNRRPFVVALAATFALSSIAGAQGVRGTVVDATDRPVAGVVLQLLDSTSAAVTRALSNERGDYRLVAPRTGTYRIRTLRIGFRSSVTEPFNIPARSDVTRRITLNNLGVSLDTLRVLARSACRIASDSSAATFAVWEQARTALTAADITSREHISGTAFAFERTYDADNLRLLKQRTAVSSSYINEPWLSLSPQVLRRIGYVTYDTANATTYYAPGIDVLLSSSFLDDHCFHLRAVDNRLGIDFEPVPDRHRIAEIRGTLWIDRASSELQSLEYGYVHISPEEEARAKGDLTFTRMRDGTWAISRWTITMPVVEQKVIGGRVERTPVGAKPELKVYELVVRGGELVLARRGADTIWSQPPRVLAGVVTDSTSGVPVGNALVSLDGTPFEARTDGAGRFRVEGMLPGNYTVEVHTSSLDSVNAVHQTAFAFTDESALLKLRVPSGKQVYASLCGTSQREFAGIVIGSVSIKEDATPPKGMSVGVEWIPASGELSADSRALRVFETRTDDHGAFRFCGVPVDVDLTLRTLSDTGSASPVTLRIAADSRFARTTLEHDYAARGGAAFVGIVVSDSLQPVTGAQVTFTDIKRGAVSAEGGRFRINDIPAGAHRLNVRRVGYSPLDTSVTFYPNQTIDRRIVLPHGVVLETVVVSEYPVPPEFEESRRLGMGSFITPEMLDKKRGMLMESVLGDVKSMHLQRTNGGHTYLVAPRPPHSGCVNEACLRQEKVYYVPDIAEKNRGITTSCYVQVYLDRTLMNPTRPTEPFDISTISLDEVVAIEFYPTRLETPLKYERSFGCGVLQLWTRMPR